MAKDSRIIDVSFKKTSRDMRLFVYVDALEEKSDFVKDAIEHYLCYLQRINKTS